MALIVGAQRVYLQKFRFRMEIANVGFAGFAKVGPIEAECAVIDQREGGALIPVKAPGLVTVPDCTCERGATRDRDLFDWFKQVADIASNAGLLDPDYKRDADVVQLGRDQATVYRWRMFNTFPRKFSAGDWDNKADENSMETVILSYDFPDRIEA